MRRKWHTTEFSANWPTKARALEKVMANILDIVSLVWRVLQLSPKPLRTGTISFIGSGSRTTITKSMETLRTLSSEIPPPLWNSEVLNSFRSSLPLAPVLSDSNTLPLPNTSHTFIASTFNVSLLSSFRSWNNSFYNIFICLYYFTSPHSYQCNTPLGYTTIIALTHTSFITCSISSWNFVVISLYASSA